MATKKKVIKKDGLLEERIASAVAGARIRRIVREELLCLLLEAQASEGKGIDRRGNKKEWDCPVRKVLVEKGLAIAKPKPEK